MTEAFLPGGFDSSAVGAEVPLALSLLLALGLLVTARSVCRVAHRGRSLSAHVRAAALVPLLCLTSALALVWLGGTYRERKLDAERIRAQAIEGRHRELVARVNQAVTLVNGIRDARFLSEAGRKQHALEQLLRVSFDGGEGYLFVLDEVRRLRSRGLESARRTSLARRSAVEMAFSEGLNLRPHVTVSYPWPSPSTGRWEPKIANARKVPRWNWVVGAGAYVDDIERDHRDELAAARHATARQAAVILVLTAMISALAFWWARTRSAEITRAVERCGARLGEAIRRRRPLEPEAEPFEELERMSAEVNDLLVHAWEQAELQSGLLSALQAGVLVLDAADETIVEVNASAATLLGSTPESLRGRRRSEVSPCPGCGVSACPATTGSWCAEPLLRPRAPPLPVMRRFSRKTVGERELLIQTVVDLSELVEVRTELASSHEELEAANLRLATALEQARALQAEAESASRAKSDFLSAVSHELRTPVHNVAGLLDLIVGAADSAVASAYAADARRGVAELLSVVDAILEFSAGETGDRSGGAQELGLNELLQSALERSSIAGRAELRGVVRLEEPLPERVRAPADRLARVLDLLVDNAVRFTESGFVELGARAGDGLEIWVADSGIGIDPSRHEDIFEAFVQVECALNRRWGGTGLGLATARRHVEEFGGTITVESELGSGARFTVRMPRFEPGAASNPIETDGPFATGSERVLVVDDNAINRKVACGMIRRLGYEVEAVEGGVEAVARLREAAFGLVFMDCQMPDVDGYETTRRVRRGLAGERHRRVPIVALTASELDGGSDRSLAAGMDGFMTKPVVPGELGAMLRRWLGPGADVVPNSPPTVESPAPV